MRSATSRVKETRRIYKVGQNVRFRPNYMSALAGTQDCKIVRLYPTEDGPYPYRIKFAAESVERVANESELALIS